MRYIICNTKATLIRSGYKLTSATEVMFYLYLPIKFPNNPEIKFEERLNPFQDLINLMLKDYKSRFNDLDSKYVYVSAKKLFVQPGYSGNRAGFHCDGFKTNDINYIWSDRDPTVFNSSDFSNIPLDHVLSMKEFEERALPENNYTFGVGGVLLLDPTVVHDVPEIHTPGFRTFFKLSISDKKFNLEGNSHNYLFDYNWRMYSRSETRNTEEFENTDFGPQE